MKRKVLGTVLVALGVGLLLVGACITGWYFWMEEQAGNRAQAALDQLLEQMESGAISVEDPTGETQQADQQEPTTGQQSGEQSGQQDIPNLSLPAVQGQVSRRPMAEIEIDGVAYIGYVEIPALELKLPVISESSEDLLDIAPCRYFGTVYQKNFVIGGHRYRRHFRKLYTLEYGDSVIFTDVTGQSYHYQVAELETIEPYESRYLCSGDWDLSLFTCTTGGASRVVVRCLSN